MVTRPGTKAAEELSRYPVLRLLFYQIETTSVSHLRIVNLPTFPPFFLMLVLHSKGKMFSFICCMNGAFAVDVAKSGMPMRLDEFWTAGREDKLTPETVCLLNYSTYLHLTAGGFISKTSQKAHDVLLIFLSNQ